MRQENGLQILRLFRFYTSIPFLCLGFLMIFYSFRPVYLAYTFGIVFILIGLILVYKCPPRLLNWSLFFSTLVWLLLAAEVMAFVVFNNEPILRVSSPAVNFHPIKGYEWTPKQPVRMFAKANGKVIIDHNFTTNNRGYISSQDYHYEKSDTAAKRFILLGDSFSAGNYMEVTLADRVQQLLNEKSPSPNTEVYNFSQSGIGLSTWGRVFKEDIIKNYNFDGILMACYGNDLHRKYMIMQCTDEGIFTGYFNNLPSNETDLFDHYLPKMRFKAPYATEEEIDLLAVSKKKYFQWPFTLRVLRTLNKISNKLVTAPLPIPSQIEEVKATIGLENFRALEQIIAYCQKNKKTFIFLAVPGRGGLHQYLDGKPGPYWSEMQLVANHFSVPFFNGYESFKPLETDKINEMYLEGDDHWNQAGSDFFAQAFASFMELGDF